MWHDLTWSELPGVSHNKSVFGWVLKYLQYIYLYGCHYSLKIMAYIKDTEEKYMYVL